MTRQEKIALSWECTLGKKSHINPAGKILLFPFIVVVASTLSVLEFLFSVDDAE